jgi:two-component system phosphate regulon response regulator PhoB
MALVLVVEDDPEIRSMVVTKLTKGGHQVLDEADGDAGLETARRERPDVVLLDWMMPKRSGVEVCQLLRTELDPVIFILTARSQIDDVRQGFSVGADDYIAKPFSPADLLDRINRALEVRQAPASGGDEANRQT